MEIHFNADMKSVYERLSGNVRFLLKQEPKEPTKEEIDKYVFEKWEKIYEKLED